MLLELCDRIVVLCGGQVSGVVDARTADKRQIGAADDPRGGRQEQMNNETVPVPYRQAGHPALVQELAPSGAAPFCWRWWSARVVTMLHDRRKPRQHLRHHLQGCLRLPPAKSWVTFQNLAVLLGISLAVTPALQNALLEHRRRGSGARLAALPPLPA